MPPPRPRMPVNSIARGARLLIAILVLLIGAAGFPTNASAALSLPAEEKCAGPTGEQSVVLTICVSVSGQVAWSPDYRVCNENELPQLPALCWLSTGEVTGKSLIPSDGGAEACIHGCEDQSSCAWYFIAGSDDSPTEEGIPGQACTTAVTAGHVGGIQDDCVYVDGAAFNNGLEDVPGASVSHQIGLDCVSPV